MVRVDKKDIKMVRDQATGQVFEMTSSAAARLDEDKEDLRRRMYDMQVQKGKFRPGPRSKYDSKKVTEQVSCCHPFGALWWGGNPSRRYAHCTACGLRRCVYQKTTMMREEREKNLKDAQHIDALLENALSWDHGL